MHWAPNFQKTGSNDYKTIGHVSLENTKILKNAYYLSMAKTGRVKGYGEIDLQGKYEFYAGLPYFEYSSTMTFNADAHLFLLRNNEMTLDKLFTHLIYPDPHGRLAEIPLYNDTHIDSLAKAPLADDISWLGFINKSMDYGLVGLTLDYDNQNKMGETSPLFEPHLKISKGRQEGRYWNRRLIHDHNVLVPEGSRYYEHNAYLILDNLDDVDGQIDHYIKCLKNPITVEYLTN